MLEWRSERTGDRHWDRPGWTEKIRGQFRWSRWETKFRGEGMGGGSGGEMLDNGC